MDANTFECKFNNIKKEQKQRYFRLAEHFNGIELSEEDKSYLLWLSGMDGDTERVFSNLFNKLEKRIAALEVPVQEQPQYEISKEYKAKLENGTNLIISIELQLTNFTEKDFQEILSNIATCAHNFYLHAGNSINNKLL